MLSYFKFQITQSVKVLLYKIKMGDGKRWVLDGDLEFGPLWLRDPKRNDNSTMVTFREGKMDIITACSGYFYTITDLPKDGAVVEFAGPVNALLAQALMPRMTYVPGTLTARSAAMPGYVSIGEFMEERAKYNAGQPNPQDAKGYRVNARFNNELAPYLPKAHGVKQPKRRHK